MTTTAMRAAILLSRLATALRFLTILPLSWRAEEDGRQFAQSLALFPLVGLAIGLLGAVLAAVALQLWPPPVVAALAIVFLGFISGFLHLDGLADSADGLLSNRSREESLAIMKDSRAGAMGIVAVVAVMLVKYASLSVLEPGQLIWTVVVMPVAGRWAILFSMARLPYARPEGGLGRLFYGHNVRWAAGAGLLLLAGLLFLVAPSRLVAALLAVLGTNLVFGRWCRRRLNGATGDTLGAACELTEATVAVVFAASF